MCVCVCAQWEKDEDFGAYKEHMHAHSTLVCILEF